MNDSICGFVNKNKNSTVGFSRGKRLLYDTKLDIFQNHS